MYRTNKFKARPHGVPASSGSSGQIFNRRASGQSGGGFGGNRFGNRGGGNRSGGNRGRGGKLGDFINPAKFVNKAVIIEESGVFVPEHKFQDFVIDETLKRAIISKGYTEPTPIQDKVIPHILQKMDVIGVANTGTGKTAAFLIPLIDKVLKNRKEQVMIVAPTRELAIQIEEELKGFTKGMKIYSVCCVGGMNIVPQIRQLRFLNNFVIGTPGRLKDLIGTGRIVLSQYGNIVLDEADRMLDMGFIADMRFIMAGMPKNRQTLFFSATISPEIDRFIKEFLREPVKISVKNRDTAKNVEQDVVKIERGSNKFDVLRNLLSQKEFCKVLIFGRTKHGVERLSKQLVEKGFKAESIHGNKNHSKRQQALRLFKDSHVQVLVATDVAARGLDIADVSHVINFDLPATYDDYVHRIGRTGRGTKSGKALTFIE